MANEPSPRLVLIVAAGTGGHLYPGIALAKALQKNNGWQILFAVRRGDMGRSLLEREEFQVLEFSGQGWPRGFSLKAVSFPFKIGAGFLQAWSCLEKLKPRVVVGMGGYLSFPVLLAARLKGIPTCIHEANVLPGLANRLLARIVTGIAISFPESAAHFPKGKTWMSGLPVREELGTLTPKEGRERLGLDSGKFTLLVFGGSLGARRLNEVMVETLPLLTACSIPFQLLHVTGEGGYEAVQKRYKDQGIKCVVLPYCHEMAAAYAAADLVISRAGASTVAELLACRKPAILVPYPYASENHQLYNAEVLMKRGVAEVILDGDLDSAALAQRIRSYLDHPERFEQMQQRFTAMTDAASLSSDAAGRLAEFVASLSAR